MRDVLNEPVADSEGFDPDTVDADFEQELEDLFADDLEDAPVVDESGGPIVLDDQIEPAGDDAEDEVAEEELLLLDDVVEEPAEDDFADESDDEDLLILDDLAEEPAGEELIVLDEVVDLVEEADGGAAAPKAGARSAAEAEALVDDIAEENLADSLDEDEEIIDLDDLVEEEPAEAEALDDEDEMLLDLDDLIEEEAGPEPEEEISLELEEPAEEPEDELSVDVTDDLLAAAMAEEPAPEVPVDEAVAPEDIEAIMDEPEAEPEIELEAELEIEAEEPDAVELNEAAIVEGNLFTDAVEAPVDAELTGLEQLEDDDIEDVDSLLDNVEVDVSGVMDAEESDADLGDDMVMDLDEGSLDDVLAAEAMPPDAGMDVDADVDLLLAETREEPSLEALQATVRQLEGRVEELERRLREEIAQLVPAEAAKIIREEIAALAAELDD
ncbi:hypothetical protein AB6M95_12010 [Pseudodesulfovibrio sp. 9FUS]|uniref:Pilus assembly protein FimV n=1 Tax=Pseudodesulfovibrio karagichevae TaxID=3239305 RepID=A0ABV4K3I7_9BACT